MNIDGFRFKHIKASTSEEATDELNEFLQHCDKVGKSVRDITYHTYRTNIIIHCYVVRYDHYTNGEKNEFQFREI
ncbi:hypothetical protein [Paraliobacillus zengyii]|uniref:hypothetical protein n=1 Tax=Paraliobacillus zengyii TaxID=2213194 RepID=UPI000DD327D3|nr:hypothetical protein [Paraliobacillus zengyii]